MKHRELLAKYGTSAILESYNSQEDHQDTITIEGLLLEGMDMEHEFTEFFNEEEVETLTEAVSIDKLILESSDLSEEELTTKIESIVEAADSTKMEKFKNFIQRMLIKLQSFTVKLMIKVDKVRDTLLDKMKSISEKADNLTSVIDVKTADYETLVKAFTNGPKTVNGILSSFEVILDGKKGTKKTKFSTYMKDEPAELVTLLENIFDNNKVVDFGKVKSIMKESFKEATSERDIAITKKDINKKIGKLKGYLENNEGIASGKTDSTKNKMKGLSEKMKTMNEENKDENTKFSLKNYTQLVSYIQLRQMDYLKSGVRAIKSLKDIEKALAK